MFCKVEARKALNPQKLWLEMLFSNYFDQIRLILYLLTQSWSWCQQCLRAVSGKSGEWQQTRRSEHDGLFYPHQYSSGLEYNLLSWRIVEYQIYWWVWEEALRCYYYHKKCASFWIVPESEIIALPFQASRKVVVLANIWDATSGLLHYV